MRTQSIHGVRHVHEIVFDNDAYNSVGDHLVNDAEQAQHTILASVIGGVVSVILILAILL